MWWGGGETEALDHGDKNISLVRLDFINAGELARNFGFNAQA